MMTICVCLHCFTLESHFVYIVPSVFSCRSICETNSVRPFDVKVLDPILIFALHKAILANCKRESLESLGESLHVQTKWSGTPSLTSHQKSEKWSGTRDNLQSKKVPHLAFLSNAHSSCDSTCPCFISRGVQAHLQMSLKLASCKTGSLSALIG